MLPIISTFRSALAVDDCNDLAGGSVPGFNEDHVGSGKDAAPVLVAAVPGGHVRSGGQIFAGGQGPDEVAGHVEDADRGGRGAAEGERNVHCCGEAAAAPPCPAAAEAASDGAYCHHALTTPVSPCI